MNRGKLPGAVVAAQLCRSESEIPASTPTSRFIDHGNGTVTDTQTDLMWAKCAEGRSGSTCLSYRAIEKTWEEALNLADLSELAGYKDWRLPKKKELLSIVEERCISPAINLSVFPNTPALGFWSASPRPYGSAWYVNFGYGDSSMSARGNDGRVRLVRSGQ